MKYAFICIITLTFLFIQCKKQNVGAELVTAIENELPHTFVTVYSNNTEIFADHNPFILGVESVLITHITLLGDRFLPLTEGRVNLSLSVNDKLVTHSLDAPNAPGIYRMKLTPQTAGIGKLIFDISNSNYTDQVTIDSVIVFRDEAHAKAHQSNEESSVEISFLKEQAWKVDFANSFVSKSTIQDIIKTGGHILTAPGSDHIVTANANGIVHYTKQNLMVGTEIMGGSSILTLSGGNLSENNLDTKYKVANITLEKAKTEYARAEILVKDKLISEASFLQTKVALENAQNVFNTISKNYSTTGQKITAPLSGYIKNLFVTEGQYVDIGTPIATITKNKKLLLQVDLSQKYMDKIPIITTAHFKTLSSDQVFDLKKLNGKKVVAAKNITSDAPFVPITFEIDNVGNLLPGMALEVFLKTTPISGAITIPLTALMEEQGNYYVFVQTGGERFQKRQIKTGVNDGNNIQIISGISPGERVVTKGAYQIKIAAAAGTLPEHSHEH